jgi:iron complex outermembrane receptor protein
MRIRVGLLAGAAAIAPVSAQGTGSEEIVVTAEKRSERVQDLPIAMSAYSEAALKAAGVDGVRGLPSQAPSLNIGTKGSETFITIRGIGSEIASIGSEPGVTVAQDGVSFARHLFFNADFMDVERVEVLRGPQGTISGRNATGGAINVITRRPTEEFEASVGATIGSYERFGTEGFVSGPLDGEKLMGRFAFATERSNGWVKDEYQDQRLGTVDKVHARASLLTAPSENFEAHLIVEGLIDNSLPLSTGNIGRARPDVPSLGEQFGVPDFDVEHLRQEANQRRDYELEQYGASLIMTWDINPAVRLTSTTGYWRLDIDDPQDTDGTMVSIGDFPFWQWHLRQVSEELTLTADLTDRLDLIVGGQYLDESAEQPLEYVATLLGIGPGLYRVFPEQDLDSYAAYGQLRYRLTDELRLTAGIRYTRDEKTYFEDGFIFGPIAGGGEDDWEAVTPRFAIDWQPNDDVTVFANIARGFKAGGFNTLNFAPVDIFEPEFVWSYEAGVKATLDDGRVRAGATAFLMDYSSLQETVYSPGPGGIPVAGVENVPSATINGIELEVDADITDALRVAFSGTWLDATVDEFSTVDPLYAELGEQDFSGNRLARSPEWQFTLTGEYTVPVSGTLAATFRADYSWRSHQYFELFNHELAAQDSYGLLNMSAALEPDDGSWSVSLFGRNLTDERYLTNGFVSVIIPSAPLNLGSPGEPLTIGASFAVRY